MGQAHTVATSIEIAAPPSRVRSVFLEWHRYSEWTQRWTMSPLEPADSKPEALRAGDRIKVDMRGTAFRPVVVENSPQAFKWLGSLYGFFDGQHEFHFTPSETTPGGTTLLQKEHFTGVLTYFVREGSQGEIQTKTNFGAFNEEVKKEAERREREGGGQ